MTIDKEEFQQFVGKRYIEVYEAIKAVADKYGCAPVPWPSNADMGAVDNEIMVLLVDDLDDTIVRFEFAPED